LKAFL